MDLMDQRLALVSHHRNGPTGLNGVWTAPVCPIHGRSKASKTGMSADFLMIASQSMRSMKSTVLVVGALLAMVVSGRAASGLGDDPTKFDQLLDDAILRRDAAFIEAVVAADARFTVAGQPGGTVWDKQQFVNAVKAYSGLALTTDSIQVEQHADLVETLGHIQVKTPDSNRPEYQVYFVRLYRKGPEGWQFVSHRTVRELDGPLPSSRTGAPAETMTNPGGGTEQGPVRPGNGVTLPRVLKELRPQYTSQGMRAKIQGTVMIECVVLTDGTVGDIKVVRSLDPFNGLDEAAITAAKQWRFSPGTRNGQPVPVIVTIELTFTLGK